jgi:hypothetical protein
MVVVIAPKDVAVPIDISPLLGLFDLPGVSADGKMVRA